MTHRRRSSLASPRTPVVLVGALVAITIAVAVGVASTTLSGRWASVFAACGIAFAGGVVGFVTGGLFMAWSISRAFYRSVTGDA
ncbi:hypothetical protein [Thiomonas sp. X19]|uniref:hypothetical protein n=1 Tax=Thiomonas sp. X19 TaxID=1050370 RepID=UPI0011BD7D5B|nr:hypothetical protein [Thiomonas sp. X19]